MDYANVSINWKRVAELDEKSPVVIVPRESIQSIELRYGLQSERTWLRIPFAVVLIAAGLMPTGLILRWLTKGDENVASLFTAMVLMLPVGIWMLWTALVPGYYLAVVTDRDSRKIAFARTAKLDEIEDFLEQASDELGCRITIAVQSRGKGNE